MTDDNWRETEDGRLKRTVAKLEEFGFAAERLRDSEEYQRFLRAVSTFHNYSFYNQLLISVQRPDATYVKGYRAWQNLGRQVQRGSKSIKILAPMTRRTENGDTEVRGFRFVSVHPYEDTKPEPEIVDRRTGKVIFRGEPFEPRPWAEVSASELDSMFDPLCSLVEERTKLRIEVVPPMAGPRGWYIPAQQSITVVTQPTVGAMLRTLIHELSHAFDPDLDADTVPSTKADRADLELVAESGVVLAADHLNWPDVGAANLEYLASWGSTPEDMVRLGKRVSAGFRRLAPLLDDARVAARCLLDEDQEEQIA